MLQPINGPGMSKKKKAVLVLQTPLPWPQGFLSHLVWPLPPNLCGTLEATGVKLHHHSLGGLWDTQ